MKKDSPVVQLAILSLHILTTRGQTLAETPTAQIQPPGRAHGDALTSVLEQRQFSLNCSQYIRDNRLDNTASVAAWCAQSHNGSDLLCSADDLEAVRQHLCSNSRANGSYPATSSVEKELGSTVGNIDNDPNIQRRFSQGNARKNEIISTVRHLSNRCERYMITDIQKLIAPKGCAFLASKKVRLLENFICTKKEYEHLQVVVCGKTNNPRYLLGEKSSRNDVLGIIQNGVSDFCYSSLFPNNDELKDNSYIRCQKLQSSGQLLVAEKICRQQEVDTLTSELCFPPAERASNEQRRRDEINDVVHNDVTGKCREAMLSRKTNMRGKTVAEACGILKAFHEILLNTDFCTREDYEKLEVVTCGPGHRETINTLVLLLCLYLASTR